MQQPKIEHNPLVGDGPIKQEPMDLLDPHHPLIPSAALSDVSSIDPMAQLPGQRGPVNGAQVVLDPSQTHHLHHLRPNYRHSGNFTRLAFHNPFEMNSYPITNPPILDSTVIPYGDLSLRRRISISNGQIGQIVNHEAIFLDDDLLDDLNDLSPYMPTQNGPPAAAPDQRILLFDVGSQSQSQSHSVQLHQLQQLQQLFAQVPRPLQGPVITAHQSNQHGGLRAPFQEMAHLSSLATPGPPPLGPTDVNPPASQDMAGVPPPNHQLIYNNEVIYNPNNGPIPGTAAWKKERLLERNRIAASKCRQRKKHAQQQLQDSMNKSKEKIKDQVERLQKYEQLLSIYNAALAKHFDTKSDASLEPLRSLVNKPIDDISLASLGL